MKNTMIQSQQRNPHTALKFGMILCSFFIAFSATANENTLQTSQSTLDKTTRARVVTSLIKQLEDGYVFPDKAKKLGQILHRHHKNGDYKDIKNGEQFATMLTDQLQQETGDKHLQIEFNPQGLPATNDPKELAAREAFEMDMWRVHNFGIEKIERLGFNIGYFKLSAFGPVKEVGPLLASTMNLLNNMDSLIIDLRGNFGGDEHTVSLLASYLLDKRTHLLNMYKRKANSTEQHWSSDYVDGKRFAQDKDIYILIDNDSFSAAEDFSYTMKNLKRATLIGENTGGAANSGDTVPLDHHFSLFLPTGRGISPITNTNWEGKGVDPDVRVPASEALNEAQKIILQKLLTKEQDPNRVDRLKAHIATLSNT